MTKTTNAVEQWKQWMLNVGRSPSTIHHTLLSVNAWLRDMKLEKASLDDITTKHVEKWVNRGEDFNAGSRIIALSALRSFFEFCLGACLCKNNPCKGVKVNMEVANVEEEEEFKPLTKRDIDTLVKAADDFMRVAIPISWETGMRLSEIAQIDWKTIKSLDLSDRTRELVKDISKRDPVYCFPEDRELSLDVLKRAQHSWKFKRLAAKVGLDGYSFTDIRSSRPS